MFAFLGALAGGLFSVAGGVASGALGLAGAGVSALGGLASGAGGLLFGTPAAGVTVAQKMAAIAEPGYYDTVDVLGGITASAVKTVDYLGNLAPTAAGIYQLIAPPKVEAPATARAPTTIAPPVLTPTIAGTVLPTLSQQPKIMTVGAAAKPEPNYLLYIGLAGLALFLLRKK